MPASAQQVAAQASSDLPVTTFDAITIIADIEDPQSTFGSAYTVTQRELEKFESSNVNRVLQTVPGVYVREDDGLGAFPRIGIRASSAGRSDRINVLEDGIPAAMAPYANTSAYFFPNISRMRGVEVLKGPETLLHGPQTVTGVVNLLATAIPDDRAGFLRVEVGDKNTRRIHAWYGDQIGAFGFLLETFQGETDGFQRIDRSSLNAGNDIEEYILRLRWVSERQRVEFKAQYADEWHNISYLGLTDADWRADPDRRYGLSELERMDRGRTGFSLRHEFDFSDTWRLNSAAYWTDTHRHYRRVNRVGGIDLGVTTTGAAGVTSRINNDPTSAQSIALQAILDGGDATAAVRYGNNLQEFTSQGVQFELHGDFRTGPLSHNLTFGVRRHEDETRNVATVGNETYNQVNGRIVLASAPAATPSQGEAEAWSIWLANRINVGDWSFLPIVRYEDIETIANVANPTGARNSLDNTSFGIGANYALTENWTLLAGVYQGFAPPGSGAAQGTLGEESVNWEAGVRYRNNGFGVDAIAFLSDYDTSLRQCLFANPCVGAGPGGTTLTGGETIHQGAKEVYGLELGLFATLFEGDAFRIPVRLTYTYTDGEYTESGGLGSVLAGDMLDWTPPHIATLQIGIEHQAGWDVYAALSYLDETCVTTTCNRPGVNDTFLRTHDLFTVDLSASYDLTEAVEVYAKMDNVFDERAITHRGADGARGNPGRYAGIGLRVNF